MTVYTSRIDTDAITALDFHTHVEADHHGHLSLDQELMDASAAYFRGDHPRTPTVDDLAAYYRERNMAAVIFTIDAGTGLGHPPLSSEEIAEQAAAHADVLIPFGSVDPHRGADAIAQARRLVEDYGVKGFKFHPGLQAFAPDDPAFSGLWSTLEELGVVALFHTGQTGIGAGLPGGRGIKLRYCDPALLDDVAADHPELTIVMAHPAVPWVDTQISIATHKANVYIDLSGWSPKYFPQQLVRQLNGPLRHKVLFGSDFPVITPDRWFGDLAALEIKDAAKPLLLKENALRVLGLGDVR
ncbi:4-hydroxyphenyl-beta-ketoacyl-CoA hydrolase (plasmid) [Streptomyces sp. NBC_00841]|uniref:4-hydroxyphenyl-beta-ketoacyl-CoA hydrolase n=1 Tax=Streptomyces sp. NBC_00841 TaxID=2975847 RepID=UPI002DDA0ECB|nr:4-hydroxyphenyl-beta-ketoacyl-CoA hydrolase [Streptomyces sp. NBC_00841]WSA05238.1 4-hydroxyphenyl-beta-ketoacyl-CoA hydrolase [Streptomyces sp. NBC_00841]